MKRTHKPSKPAPNTLPLLQAGTVYCVLGYHTGDFVGTCAAMTRRTATFAINAPLQSTLDPGSTIEVPLGLARFEVVQANNSQPTPLQADLTRRIR